MIGEISKDSDGKAGIGKQKRKAKKCIEHPDYTKKERTLADNSIKSIGIILLDEAFNRTASLGPVELIDKRPPKDEKCKIGN